MPSLKPTTFVEGGVVPVDMNLLWKKCRYGQFDYTKKDGTVVASTCAALITYQKDDGETAEGMYSIGNMDTWQPSEDGKTVTNLKNAEAGFSKSSNMYILMKELVNAGFPENRLPDDGDISKLEGLYAFHVGIPEPKRSGLSTAEPRADGRERVLSVPSKVIRLPGDKKTGAATAKAKAALAADAEPSEELTAKLLDFVKEQTGDDGIERKALAMAAFKKFAKDPDKDAIAKLIFKLDNEILMPEGLSIDGETITKM
jgi:hypothetical protein